MLLKITGPVPPPEDYRAGAGPGSCTKVVDSVSILGCGKARSAEVELSSGEHVHTAGAVQCPSCPVKSISDRESTATPKFPKNGELPTVRVTKVLAVFAPTLSICVLPPKISRTGTLVSRTLMTVPFEPLLREVPAPVMEDAGKNVCPKQLHSSMAAPAEILKLPVLEPRRSRASHSETQLLRC